MSLEENKAIVRRLFEEGLNRGNAAVADELIAGGFTNHNISSGTRGPAEFKSTIAMFRTAFPDVVFTIEDEIAEGDRVVARWVMRGTHLGAFRGVPPTGRSAAVGGIGIFRLEGGKVVERWSQLDSASLIRQLGG